MFDDFLSGIFSIGSLMLKAVSFISNVFDLGIGEKGRNKHIYSSRERINNLVNINEEIKYIEKKRSYDKRLSGSDHQILEENYNKRDNEFEELQKAKQQEILTKTNENKDSLHLSKINDNNPHILAWHTGQLVMKKRCGKCGRPMFIQHKQRISDSENLGFKDFFWSCTGYYNVGSSHCTGSDWLTVEDTSLLHDKDVYEFQVTSQELNTICTQGNVQKEINNRVRQHIKERDNHVLCPVHHIPMILREKRKHEGVTLDRYFLGCNNYPNCNQIVKLKSWSQLAGYLTRVEGKGILQ